MWTPDKKVGDEVALFVGGSWHGRMEIIRIASQTPTQFILEDYKKTRIRKRDGRVINGGWQRAEDVTDELRQQIAEHDKWVRISREATTIKDRLDELYRTGDQGREWIVNNIGPLMPKEKESQ